MASHRLLDQEEEDALHKSRLLNVEEKPFKRITKRLLARESLVSTPLSLPLTPPPEPGADPADADADADTRRQKKLDEWRQFKEAVTLDFAAFESSIARIQFLLTNNEKERERYAAEKLRIQSTAQDVRDNTGELRVQLEAAQKTLNLRKVYDDLTEKITSNRLLRPREDQKANLEKLEVEIQELEKESKEYAKTWSERREQFGRIVEEGMQLRRLIRDEKEEVERREGMQEGDDGDTGDGEDESKGRTSGVNSPRPDSESQTGDEHVPSKLQVERLQADTIGAASPLRQSMSAAEDKQEDDINMPDEGEVDELEEGETDEREDKMDTT
ncbi:Tho complex subunit 7-domain-containing protein [Talaromyces proteolyticus]|uniref:Tho complex subunit 7-domain-containing protein n=1 Tax=Talaromyces proteolyticus TaxID=1131652 RepID=A0AAD4PZH1_9EURO|nr:Tho complex subunit 7-domain-containing protein [Talaromyces proteolyticus]KAH8695976.1 Tho complex subunit 7-domain-containing protein [Talaromyces proteolyticus]